MNAYYQVGEARYSNAIQALMAAKDKNLTPMLALGARFDTYNWLSRPSASIFSLENERVAQIAARKLPIRLMYSGGSDSHSIAHAFLRNRVPIRYTLLAYQNLSDTQLDGVGVLGEKLTRLKLLHESYGAPDPQYEVIHIGPKEIEAHFSTRFFEHSAYYNCNQSFNVNQTESTLRWSKWAPESTVNVYGIEKPRLYQNDKGVFWQITDTMSMYANSQSYDSTWFYISDELPELTHQQCLSVMRWAQVNQKQLPYATRLHLLQTEKRFYYEWCKVLGRIIDYNWALRSKDSKVYHSTYQDPSDGRYIHVNRYKEDGLSHAWRNYTSLFEVLKDITGQAQITPVLSKRYYLTEHPMD